MTDAFINACILTACILDIAFIGGTILAIIESIKERKNERYQNKHNKSN